MPLDPEEVARLAAEESAASFANRYHYRITITIAGRVRFLSHLETVDTLLGTLRRSGVRLALSSGMRPKPRIKMAMPRPVATEAWSDIVEVELQDETDVDEFALRLSEAMPAGRGLRERGQPRRGRHVALVVRTGRRRRNRTSACGGEHAGCE